MWSTKSEPHYIKARCSYSHCRPLVCSWVSCDSAHGDCSSCEQPGN